MIDPKLATRYFQTHGLHVAMTFGLLLVAFIENYYINCMNCGSQVGGCIGGGGDQFWCGFGWMYLVLGFVLLSVAHYYRRLAKNPMKTKSKGP